jgi:outer membrane usher protein FimD/PapC
MTTFKIDTIKATSGNGGAFALTNTGATTISISSSNVYTNSKAQISGGFIYQNGGTTFGLTLNTVTIEYA